MFHWQFSCKSVKLHSAITFNESYNELTRADEKGLSSYNDNLIP